MAKGKTIEETVELIDKESVDPSPYAVHLESRSRFTDVNVNGYFIKHIVTEEKKLEFRSKGPRAEYCIVKNTKSEAMVYEHESGNVRIERSLGGSYKHFPSELPNQGSFTEHKVEPTDWKVTICPEDQKSVGKYLKAIGISQN